MGRGTDLVRFVDAQRRSYPTALAEVRAGRKRTHWMWYVFPQVQGLGSSPTSRRYAIRDLGEARAFLADPSLGHNLREISEALLGLETSDPGEVFGWPDDLKLRSSMTLFTAAAGPDDTVFQRVLDKYYGGRPDESTIRILGMQQGV